MSKDGPPPPDGLTNLRPEAPTHLPASLGFTDKQDLADHLSHQGEVPRVDLDDLEIDPTLVRRIPRGLAEEALVCPVSRADGVLLVAMASPNDLHTVDKLKFLTGGEVVAVRAPQDAIRAAIERLYPG